MSARFPSSRLQRLRKHYSLSAVHRNFSRLEGVRHQLHPNNENSCRLMGKLCRLLGRMQVFARPYKGLEVQILHAERVLLDEFAARFHDVTHQLSKQIIGIRHILDPHLQQSTCIRIKGRFP